MSWYFFTMTGYSKWQRHLSEYRQKVLIEEHPEYMTILDVNHPCEGDDIPQNLFYKGPLYFDWDGEDLRDLLDDVKRFMNRLEGFDFDLNQASWWLSGKKGIHCTIPMECLFDKKSCQVGIKDLFRVYGRYAWENATTYMDMRVYSGRKGRMWRTANRARDVEGRTTYKVPITPDDLRALDADGYWQWCSEQRPDIVASPATINPTMAMDIQVLITQMFVEHKKRGRVKVNPDIFKDWVEPPPTVTAAFNGENVDMGRGLNEIGLQFATAAIALGLDSYEDTGKFLEMCEGFIRAREGQPGVAHQTRAAIVDRLTKSFHYCIGNPNYVYLPETFASILTLSNKANLDLHGVKPGVTVAKIEDIKSRLQAGLLVDELAVYKTSREGFEPIVDYSWVPGSLRVVRDPIDNRITHYSVIAIVGGVEQPRKVVPIEALTTLKAFNEYVVGYSATSLLSTNAQVSALRRSLINFVGSQEDLEEIKTTKMEGIHLITTADPEEGQYQGAMFWVEAAKTTFSSTHYNDKVPLPTYLDPFNTKGQFGVDLSEAYEVADHLRECQEVVGHLLELNGDVYALGIMLSWFAACPLKHVLYQLKRIRNFPVLQIVGQAGCGKTTTANLLLQLFTWKKPFRVNMAGKNLTPYAMSSLAMGSTSIPLVIDEVKGQNNHTTWMADFRSFIQTIYTIGSEARRGGGDGTITSSYRSISSDAMMSPTCFLAEALEASQASILERSVVASFHKAHVSGREKHARFLGYHERNLGMLGWGLVQHLMSYDLDALVKMHASALDEADRLLKSGNNHRVIENAAMMLTGFDFFSGFIEKHFPSTFSTKLQAIRYAMSNPDRWLTKVTSEVVRLMSLLSNASYSTDESRMPCRRGYHYTYEVGESIEGRVEYLVVHIERCYYLYREWMKSIASMSAFHSIEETKFALANSVMAVDVIRHPELNNGECIKMSLKILNSEGVQSFKR